MASPMVWRMAMWVRADPVVHGPFVWLVVFHDRVLPSDGGVVVGSVPVVPGRWRLVAQGGYVVGVRWLVFGFRAGFRLGEAQAGVRGQWRDGQQRHDQRRDQRVCRFGQHHRRVQRQRPYQRDTWLCSGSVR